MIVIDIFSAVEFKFLRRTFKQIWSHFWDCRMQLIFLVAALKLDNCILPIRLNPDQQKSRVAFLMANPQQMIPLGAKT